ncbi:hypothetical protein HYT45_04065 [Candidatus Uhrbacteria bacterium]|nr:hypothetical protein [Candidatus Wildermuthbacteria bacterium]MBI2099549.1 hypothetical protein [Candidatus Uhrbacteria bacterium]
MKLKKILSLIVFISYLLVALPAFAGELPNPLGTSDIRIIIANIIRAALGIVGSIALLMFIYGGFLWLTSGGNDEKVKKGKDTLVWATLGIATIFAAYAILNFVIGALTRSAG